MKAVLLIWTLLCSQALHAAPRFVASAPSFNGSFAINSTELCATAQHTLAYLNKGAHYDPLVIHQGKIMPIPLVRVKATLNFVCQHQAQLNNPAFIRKHFDFIRWYPDTRHAKNVSAQKVLVKNLPSDRILMTKYYVHLAQANLKKQAATPYALYGLPKDEAQLTLEQADARPYLIRFKYGKQAILAGALEHQTVPSLAYFSRNDLESALLQGTVVADFGRQASKKIFNVHRNNNIAYDRNKAPYEQERYWYFKEVDGIKGYGKDAEHKITVNPGVTFAADLAQFGLGKMLLIQYKTPSGTTLSRAGIFADTGGAFADNLYQVDYLAGSYPGAAAFSKATQNLPDYVEAYFMVLKL